MLSNSKVNKSNEISQKEIIIDFDAHFLGQMQAELQLKLFYEKLWIKNVPVRVTLKIKEIFTKLRLIIAPRKKGVTQSFMSFLGKPYVTYEIVPHFESINFSFNLKLEREDFSLSSKIIDLIFEELIFPNKLKIPIPLTRKNKQFKKPKQKEKVQDGEQQRKILKEETASKSSDDVNEESKPKLSDSSIKVEKNEVSNQKPRSSSVMMNHEKEQYEAKLQQSQSFPDY